MLQAEQELFKTIKAFDAWKQEEGKSVSTYVSKMKAYLDQKERLGYPMPLVLGGLKGYQKLNKGALDLYVGNGNTTAVEAIGSFDLILPSGMILIDMHNHISNERSIYTCSKKKSKHNLDFTFLWHFFLGHINKKHIEKLQHDALVKSIDDEFFDIFVSCISGKMARKPFTYASKRADDQLGKYIAIFARIPYAPERYGFYINDGEHDLGDHGKPPNYRAVLSIPKSAKWLEAIP
nr:zinc finger, CCHC-type [Tanacetum cinerariifolium]